MDSATHKVPSILGDQSVEHVGAHEEPEDEDNDSHQPLVPPYWQHRRYESYNSVKIIKPSPITLVDHTEDISDCESPLWAKGVRVSGYVVISGNLPSVGDYIVWNCKIDTLDVRPFLVCVVGAMAIC